MNEPEPGMRVIGIRGTFVGLVSEVGTEAVLVAPEGKGQAYWLRREAIIGVEGNRVELICDSEEVGRYTLSKQGL